MTTVPVTQCAVYGMKAAKTVREEISVAVFQHYCICSSRWHAGLGPCVMVCGFLHSWIAVGQGI
jgi:hypothetical protein